jgi:hypothetical protein
MSRLPSGAVLFAAAIAIAPRGAEADDALIVPFTTFRDLTLIVSVLDDTGSESQGVPATSEEQGPFDATRDLSVGVPSATAQGLGVQISDIGTTGLQGEATLSTAVSAGPGGAASTIASNEYQVTFATDGPVQYSLQGSLAAFDEGACTFTFRNLVGTDIHSFTVANDSIPLDFTGELPSGTYFLVAQLDADLNVDLVEEASLEARASFAFDFTVCSATPVERRSWSEVKGLYRRRVPDAR